jgi:transposase-like protein
MNKLQKLRKNLNSSSFQNKLTARFRMGLHSEEEIWQLYGVNRSLLRKWNQRYYRFRILPPTRPVYMKSPKKSDKARIAELERQLKQLKAAYQDEKLAKEMYLKMIRIAEEEFEIPIRKKPGAKQSRKDDGTTRS